MRGDDHGDTRRSTRRERQRSAREGDRGGPQNSALTGWRLLKVLIGSGDKTGLLVLPFLLAGLVLNIVYPAAFDAGGPPTALRVVSIVVLIPGVTI